MWEPMSWEPGDFQEVCPPLWSFMFYRGSLQRGAREVCLILCQTLGGPCLLHTQATLPIVRYIRIKLTFGLCINYLLQQNKPNKNFKQNNNYFFCESGIQRGLSWVVLLLPGVSAGVTQLNSAGGRVSWKVSKGIAQVPQQSSVWQVPLSLSLFSLLLSLHIQQYSPSFFKVQQLSRPETGRAPFVPHSTGQDM